MNTLVCPFCRQEIASIFEVTQFEIDNSRLGPPSVWQDYCYSVCNLNHKRMVMELSDPQFEFSSLKNCDPSWLQADKRMVRIAAEAFITNDFSEMKEGGDRA